MSYPLRQAAAVARRAAKLRALRKVALVLVLGGCGSDSSTSVVVKVDNSIDPDDDPNLVVVIRDQDEPDPPTASLSAAMEGGVTRPNAVRSAAGAVDPALAWVEPGGIVLAGEGGELVERVGCPLLDGIAGLSWSADGQTLWLAASDGLHVSRAPWSEFEPLTDLPGVSSLESGPVFEVTDGWEIEVILASAPPTPGAPEDLFAIFVAASGAVLGVQNLTGTPERRELDAAWLPDGMRIALLERSEHDVILLGSISVDLGPDGFPQAELEKTGPELWASSPGTLADLSSARIHDLLAVSAWTGSDWDALCVDLRGEVVNLGSGEFDEFSPSWSRDDLRMAVVQRCTSAECVTPLIRVLELDPPADRTRCPDVAGAREAVTAAAHPVWRP